MQDSRAKQGRRRRRVRKEDRRPSAGPLSSREELRLQGYRLLVQLAYDLEWLGMPCRVRLPGSRDELPVLDVPGGGPDGVMKVGTRKERDGWQFTWGTGAGTGAVWAANEHAPEAIIAAVSP
ncbi:hypothetical protein [Acrocarpospora sp. B8E8]|uniref:hypothetical protein n=1 Tax=Acrocarpospora sp. B8E8 TaxID=3153572 RepID=UPI00325ECA00